MKCHKQDRNLKNHIYFLCIFLFGEKLYIFLNKIGILDSKCLELLLKKLTFFSFECIRVKNIWSHDSSYCMRVVNEVFVDNFLEISFFKFFLKFFKMFFHLQDLCDIGIMHNKWDDILKKIQSKILFCFPCTNFHVMDCKI